jgi:beta-glucanase (GH16 family)
MNKKTIYDWGCFLAAGIHEPQHCRTSSWLRGWMLLIFISCQFIVVSSSPAQATNPPAYSSPQVPQPVRGQGYRLVKNWDFTATVRDEPGLRSEFYTRYVYNGGRSDFFNDERERYRDNANHVFEEGALALVARLNGSPEKGQIESGMLRSKWTGKYGYFECCMKLPSGRGLWPAFWLNPQDQKWPPEIDALENVNNGRDTTLNSFHFLHGKYTGAPPAGRTLLDHNQSYHPGFDYAKGFHTFAVEWTPSLVRHYVDDILVVERPFQWRHDDGSDGGPAHILVNLAVGGKWAGDPTSAADFPAKLMIRYIRVWQKNPSDIQE